MIKKEALLRMQGGFSADMSKILDGYSGSNVGSGELGSEK
jgi:hypothetical protein